MFCQLENKKLMAKIKENQRDQKSKGSDSIDLFY